MLKRKKVTEREKVLNKRVTQSEYEEKVLELAKKDITSEKIGEALRKEGIHSKEYEKKISHILKEKSLYVNADLKNVETKLEKIRLHFGKNKQDKRAMRERDRIAAQVRKLKAYFKVQ